MPTRNSNLQMAENLQLFSLDIAKMANFATLACC